MGYLPTYCKKCDALMSAFGADNIGGVHCPKCGTYNTSEEVGDALFNPDFHKKKRLIELRKLKIKKLLNG